MKIVVIGGTGLTGSKLIKKLRAKGHDALAAAPNTGVNTITGEGLKEALSGAQVVVDLANAPLWRTRRCSNSSRTSGRNPMAAEKAAGVKHHLALSIVGSHRTPTAATFAKGGPGKSDQGLRDSVHDPALYPVLRVRRRHRQNGPRGRRGSAVPRVFQPIASDDWSPT